MYKNSVTKIDFSYIMQNSKPDYAEFFNPKLAAIYNTVAQHSLPKKTFFLHFAQKTSATEIIDIGCGTGLLTLEFAKLGYQMIGVEPAKAMLEVAYQNPQSQKVTWLKGDAGLLTEIEADLAFMTAHVAQFLLEDKYFLKTLKAICKALKPSGYLLFDSRNPQMHSFFNPKIENTWPVKDSPQKFTDPQRGEIQWWVELQKVEGNRATYENHYFFEDSKEELTSVNELIFRSKEKIVDFLQQAGFKVDKIYGDWDSSEAIDKSPEFIFVARKE